MSWLAQERLQDLFASRRRNFRRFQCGSPDGRPQPDALESARTPAARNMSPDEARDSGVEAEMEEVVALVAGTAGLLIEAAAVLIVTFGAVDAFVRLMWVVATPGVTHGERKAIWRRFGMWLLLGLEFELAADIIGSVLSPTWQEVGKLGAIAVIRTFLNYFLEKDLESADEAAEAKGLPKPAEG
jgi:uncharacterized membrane protein